MSSLKNSGNRQHNAKQIWTQNNSVTVVVDGSLGINQLSHTFQALPHFLAGALTWESIGRPAMAYWQLSPMAVLAKAPECRGRWWGKSSTRKQKGSWAESFDATKVETLGFDFHWWEEVVMVEVDARTSKCNNMYSSRTKTTQIERSWKQPAHEINNRPHMQQLLVSKPCWGWDCHPEAAMAVNSFGGCTFSFLKMDRSALWNHLKIGVWRSRSVQWKMS